MRSILSLLLIGIIPILSVGQSGGSFVIEKSLIAGGGGSMSGGTFNLDGSIGQPFGGATSAGGSFTVGSGFWGGGLTLASAVSVSGKVTTPDGRGLRNAIVSITDSQNVKRSVATSASGLYTFDNVATGQPYTVKVASKLYRFNPLPLSVGFENLTGVNFVGAE